MPFHYGDAAQVKPGQQGTLFKDQGWTRGYTPERKQAVESTVRFVGPPQANAQARDTIARSTVPLHRLTRLTVQPTGLPKITDQQAQVRAGKREDVRYGQNNRGRNTVQLATPTATGLNSPRSQDVRGQILIHEVGHHVGEQIGRPTPQNDVQRGKEEGHADNFLARHYRPDPRTVKSGQTAGDYSYRGQSNVEGRSRAFAGGYNVIRNMTQRQNPMNSPTRWDQGYLPL